MTNPIHTPQHKQPARTLKEEIERDSKWYEKYKSDKERFQKEQK